ncbi:MAG: hypothetical protein IKL22_06220 [Lachnospiraceae bacterium]|nr:hypothetical protein [Lachnospiraceae bacterium]
MKKRVIATMLICGLCVGMLSGCGEEEESSSRREKKSDKSKTESTKELSDVLGELFGKEEKADEVITLDPETIPSATEEIVWTDEWPDEESAEPTEPVADYYPEEEDWEVYEPTEVTPDEEIEECFGPTYIIDPWTGKPYDLGGMEIIIRDWWSYEEPREPQTDYEEARAAYLEWIQETYNFTIKEMAIGDWGSVPEDFVDYVSMGGDDNNYIFTLRDNPAVTAAMAQGMMYDLSMLDCLDFEEYKYSTNKVHELYAKDGSIYAMSAGYAEPRVGMWFNKRVLEEAGIDPESIYDMQAAGTWTWDAWMDIMEVVQRDVNGDGVDDIYGMDANYSTAVLQAVYSNDAELVGLDEYGDYVYKFEDPATLEALNWITEIFETYGVDRPADASWNYYTEAFLNGYVAFCPEEADLGLSGRAFADSVDELGFVMFPKGPNADDYTNCWSEYPLAIPACYDDEKAWKIAFAWNLYSEEVPGYEGYIDLGLYRAGNFDSRAVDETIMLMMEKGMVAYHNMIPNLDINSSFLYRFGRGANTVVEEVHDTVRDTYMYYIDEANR